MMRIAAILLLLLAFSSCQKGQDSFSSPKEFNDYINDASNGFITSSESEDLKFEAKLIPPTAGDEVRMCTMQLRILRKDGKSVLEYGDVSQQVALEREGYLSFEVIKDVSLQVNGSDVPAVFHHYERNYGLKPSVDVFFNFTIDKPVKKDVVFSYRDQLFGQGLTEIKFNKDLFNECYVEEK